jgi:hypothetical protein
VQDRIRLKVRRFEILGNTGHERHGRFFTPGRFFEGWFFLCGFFLGGFFPRAFFGGVFVSVPAVAAGAGVTPVVVP